MSRFSNGIRGPASALTDYLRESGITPTTIARRVATQVQPTAGTSTADSGNGQDVGQGQTSTTPSRRRARGQGAGYTSDTLDEPESPPKKQKLSKASLAKAKAKAKKEAEDAENSEEDAYTALSKSMWSSVNSPTKPPVGSFENCAKCEKKFTVTKYTIASTSPPGFLCHQCAKASGMDPFKKSIPKKRKAPAEKRQITHIEPKRLPSLVSLCVQVVSRHIDDIDAFGDIGALNMDAINKAISKNRSLTPENATLFYGAEVTNLTLYDATKLTPDSLVTLGRLSPNLTSLRLDYCGLVNDQVLTAWCSCLPNLISLELFGPFLVRPPAWIAFFQAHPRLSGFQITQSPRFDLECLRALIENCSISILRLREIAKMSDEFLELIQEIDDLTQLDISEPTESCSTDAVLELLEKVGPSLTSLNLSNHLDLNDELLDMGLKPYVSQLSCLSLAGLPLLTDEGMAGFFENWIGVNPPLIDLNLSRNPSLSSASLLSILRHSGSTLQKLNLNGWKDVENNALLEIGKHARELRLLDLGWCRETDDFVLQGLSQESKGFLKEVKVWGCNRVEGKWTQTYNSGGSMRVTGIESETL